MSAVRALSAPKHLALRLLGLLLGCGALACAAMLSVSLGAKDITLPNVYQALVNFDGSFDQVIIRTVRLPRVIAGILVGAALAVSGAIMQGLTRNPLADPGILGIEAGAAFAVVIGVELLGSPALLSYALFAACGAAVAAILVYGLSSMGKGGVTALKLTLAGTVFSSFVGALTTALLLLNQDTLDQVRFWTAGSLAGRDAALLAPTAPLIAVGLVSALLLGRQLTTLSLGQDIAAGLGQNTFLFKILCTLVVVVLAGSAVALAGPIGFVGLVVPHIVRLLAGIDYRWILPYAALLGAILVLAADVAARLLLRPQELPVGVMMALIGAPFFIYLARYKVKR